MKKLVEKIQAEIDAFVVNAGAQVVKGYSRAPTRLYFFYIFANKTVL